MLRDTRAWHQVVLIVWVLVSYLLIRSHYLEPLHQAWPVILPTRYWTEDGLVNLATFTTNVGILDQSVGVGMGVGKASEEQLYGLVAEGDLPWFTSPSVDLNDLRTRYGANRLINAFRTTLPDPILQEEYNVATAAAYLAGTIVQPREVFSLNRAIGPRTKNRGFGPGPLYVNGTIGSTIGGGICKVATTMYNVAIHSDLPVIERHPHSMLVPYVPPGRDATVLWGSKDLQFINNRDHPLVIWAEMWDHTLYIAIYGQYDPPLVEWYSEEVSRIPTWTIRRKNSTLEPGETRLIEGAEGVSVKTWINIDCPSLPLVEKYLGMDSYRPLPNYLEYGP
ncbi:MAG: VanW family protein [Firmicutes bacterium]|nr:VanW family protein [Bacillota bacterium]